MGVPPGVLPYVSQVLGRPLRPPKMYENMDFVRRFELILPLCSELGIFQFTHTYFIRLKRGSFSDQTGDSIRYDPLCTTIILRH